MDIIHKKDPLVARILEKEHARQSTQISLIASENYASQAVCAATGSVLTNKYAEGYPGKRYYAGCIYADEIEQVAIDRCKQLFRTDHANVQPHSGSQANLAAYFACLKPGDTIMGMRLTDGGHLTHGHKVNISGTWFNAVSYGVDSESEYLDYNVIAARAEQYKPKLIIAGASSYSRIIDFEKFSAIAHNVNALLLADIAHIAGLVATGLHPSPVNHADIITSTTHKTLRGPRGGLIMGSTQYAEQIDRAIIPGIQGGPLMHIISAKAIAFHEALQPSFKEYQQNIINNAHTMAHTFSDLGYRIVSGGTDNHMFVIDLRNKNITGLAAERVLEQVGIHVSRSTIPNDPQKPWITSGIRIGTPAITTRGMQKAEAITLAHLVDETFNNIHNTKVLHSIAQRVKTLALTFPVNPWPDIVIPLHMNTTNSKQEY